VGRTVAIVNPQSDGGRTARRWPAVCAALRERIGDFETRRTRERGHASRLAYDAQREGADCLVVAGGDGTIGEVVHGLLAADVAQHCTIGILPLGSGGDFVRTLGVDTLEAALDALAKGAVRSVDAGRVCFEREAGDTLERFFANEASCGLSAQVAAEVAGRHRRLGGSLAFAHGALRAIAAFAPRAVRIEVDGRCVHDGPHTLVACSNGRYFGGGMHVAPEARVDDGLLDVVVGDAMTRTQLLGLLPRIYGGRHIGHPAVATHRGRRVRIEPAEEDVSARVELDGEALGRVPAVCEVVPGALRVVAPPAGGR